MNQTGQYGQWGADRKDKKATVFTEDRRKIFGKYSPVTDGHAEMSRCVCVPVCLCVFFIGFYANSNTKLVSNIFSFILLLHRHPAANTFFIQFTCISN